jgi:transcriptional regulator with XRE-family HTH domain
MIFADKLIDLRKKNGWSQEELAAQLGVSRQAVSKWEGAQSVPDLAKVIAMADLFGVSTDYLLKDEIGAEALVPAREAADRGEAGVRWVSMEEANDYLDAARVSSGRIALGVLLCILSPIPMILLSILGDQKRIPLSADQGGIAGLILLILLAAGAVFLFVTSGLRLSRYEYLEKEAIDTEYGVTGMVKERRAAFERTFTTGLTVGIILCVLSVIPILTGIFTQDDLLAGIGVCVMLAMCAAGVWLIVRVCVEWGSYQKLLEEGDYTRKTKLAPKGWLSGAYWSLVTAVFLAYSFWKKDWANSWIIWPVAGVLYAVIAQIERGMMKK